MPASPELIEKIKAHILKKGARSAAIKLVDAHLNAIMGLGSSDLADTVTFANGLDEIEVLLGQGEFQEAFETARDTAKAMAEDEGFPEDDDDDLDDLDRLVRRGGHLEESPNDSQSVSEIYQAIKQLVDRDGTTQTAYSLVDMALKKINNGNGMHFVPKSELTKNLLASLERLLNEKRYDEAYLISTSHAKRIKQELDGVGGGHLEEVRKVVRDVVRDSMKPDEPAV